MAEINTLVQRARKLWSYFRQIAHSFGVVPPRFISAKSEQVCQRKTSKEERIFKLTLHCMINVSHKESAVPVSFRFILGCVSDEIRTYGNCCYLKSSISFDCVALVAVWTYMHCFVFYDTL